MTVKSIEGGEYGGNMSELEQFFSTRASLPIGPYKAAMNLSPDNIVDLKFLIRKAKWDDKLNHFIDKTKNKNLNTYLQTYENSHANDIYAFLDLSPGAYTTVTDRINSRPTVTNLGGVSHP